MVLNRRFFLVFLVLLVSLLPGTAWAQAFEEFVNFRQCDSTGTYYLVVKKAKNAPEDASQGTPVTFEFARRKEGTEPVTNEVDQFNDFVGITANESVSVREGDTVLGQGELVRCPQTFLISSTGQGFVGLDVRGSNYGYRRSKNAMISVDSGGKIRYQKSLLDLFSKAEIDQWESTTTGISWLGGGWIDERRGEAVIVGQQYENDAGKSQRLFRSVKITTGDVRSSDPDVINTALEDVNEAGLDLALELTKALAWKKAEPHLPPLLANEKLSIDTRITAACVLAGFGDLRGAKLMISAALDGNCMAVQNLPPFAGRKAAKILCEAVRRHGDKVSGEAWQAMISVPSHIAVPELVRVLKGRKSAKTCDFAMLCLSDHAAEAGSAVPLLIKILKNPPKTESPEWTRQHAAIVLGKIGPAASDALPILISLAEKYAPEEWKMAQQGLFKPQFDENRIAESDFVDAIWKIKTQQGVFL